MALYISKVVLPGGSTQYLIKDSEARAMIAPEFNAEIAYEAGDHVIYNGNLYRFHQAHSAGVWNVNHVDAVTVDSEIQRLETLIGDSGLRYVGMTYTALYDGSTATTVAIVGGEASHTAKNGDIVFYPLDSNNTSIKAYATGIAFNVNDVIRHNDGTTQNPHYRYYRANSNIAAAINTSFDAIEFFVDYIGEDNTNLEFLYNGSIWNLMGGASEFGSLAYKDFAQGTLDDYFDRATVTSHKLGTVTKKGLQKTTILPVTGSETVSKMTAGTAVDVAKVGTAVRYGTANVGTAVTYGTANKAASATTVGNANVGQAVVYGTADVGSAVTVATAGTQVVYGTANVGTAVIAGSADVGTIVNNVGIAETTQTAEARNLAVEGVVTSYANECLTFDFANTTHVRGVSSTENILPAVLTTRTITPAVAAPTTQKLTPVGGTTNITPAVSADNTRTLTPAVASSTTIYGAVDSTSTLTPAVAAPSSQTIIPAVANGSITPWTEATKTVATADSTQSVQVVTGLNNTGTDLVTEVAETTETNNVDVITKTKVVTVS